MSMSRADTSLDFQIRDIVSRHWVWNATFRLQGRVIRSHFQSDRGPVTYTFTHLVPGEATLEISAPSYLPKSIPVTVKRGTNRLDSPIELIGYEIPDLTTWVVFEENKGEDIVLELRPIDSNGSAIINHPALDLWIGARISVKIEDDSPVGDREAQGRRRGEVLFEGALQWQWDPRPETTFRYNATISGSRIRHNADPYWVIDYLIVVPDPRKTNRSEIDQFMAEALDRSPEDLIAQLNQHEAEGKLALFMLTSWDVEGAGP